MIPQTKSRALKISLSNIKSILYSNKECLSRADKNKVDTIGELIDSITDIRKGGIILQVGLNEKIIDRERTIKLLEDGRTGLYRIKLNIENIIKKIDELEFKSGNGQIDSKSGNILQKIGDWIIQDVIHQVITIITIFILLWLGLGWIKSI